MPALPQSKSRPAARRPAAPAGDPARVREVEAALDLIRPAVRDDEGDVELVGVDGDLVRIRFQGACVGCPSSEMTLRHGIERHLVEQVPGVGRVEAVED